MVDSNKDMRAPRDREPWQAPAWYEAVHNLPDGSALGGVLMDALHAELAARAKEAGGEDVCPRIELSDLRVRHAQMPDWWGAARGLALAAKDAKFGVNPPMLSTPGSECLLVMGRRTGLANFSFSGAGGVLAIGDGGMFHAARFNTKGRSSILIGEGSSATFAAHVGAYNGGAIVVGAEAMWADAVRLATDDLHAIRDLETGERVNVYGGRIVIGRHVWLCAGVHVLGGSRIGAHSIIGEGALVTKGELPPNSVCVGRPAKPVRSGVTWTREDAP